LTAQRRASTTAKTRAEGSPGSTTTGTLSDRCTRATTDGTAHDSPGFTFAFSRHCCAGTATDGTTHDGAGRATHGIAEGCATRAT
jgi:ketosteroid isomerase-like protein